MAERVGFTWDGTRIAEQESYGSDGRVHVVTWDYEPNTWRAAAQTQMCAMARSGLRVLVRCPTAHIGGRTPAPGMANWRPPPQVRQEHHNLSSGPRFTWNPMVGCSEISPGCGLPRFDGDAPGGCYAIRMAARLQKLSSYAGTVRRSESGQDQTGTVNAVPERPRQPLAWRTRRWCS